MRATAMVLAAVWGLLTAATAEAPVARRCVDDAGAVRWQSAPCDAGWRETSSRPIDDAPDATGATVTVRTATRPRARRGGGAARPAVDPVRARCAAARRAADARREREWNRLGFRERSQLDADVARACAR